jgi:hypothetical protein
MARKRRDARNLEEKRWGNGMSKDGTLISARVALLTLAEVGSYGFSHVLVILS